uniref:Interleukin-17 n=1 Tax=Callorhinchus milii TaxID=7868 RepID=K4G6I0_CALMI|nr:interleukin-17 [Callorhinchus milii]AFM87491.1 interleukin-17 [Callorhinchus milii]
MFMKVQLFVCLVFLSWLGQSVEGRTHCAEPSDKKLSQQLRRVTPSYSLNPVLELVADEDLGNSHRMSLREIGEQSTSPWSYRVNSDKTRYPRKLLEAHCLLKACLGADHQIDPTMKSVPFNTTITVLRRREKCKHGTHLYKVAQENIAMFCVCVVP